MEETPIIEGTQDHGMEIRGNHTHNRGETRKEPITETPRRWPGTPGRHSL